jgi:hypothetical protein
MKNTDNRNNGEEKWSLVPGTKPFTVYKFIELGVCLVAVLAGVLYLYAKIIPLTVLSRLLFFALRQFPCFVFSIQKNAEQADLRSIFPQSHGQDLRRQQSLR